MIPNLYPAPEYVRHSYLRVMDISAAHMMAWLRHPRLPTTQMAFGSLTHSVVLGTDDYVTWEGNRVGKAWKKFKDEHSDKLIVKPSELERAKTIAKLIECDPNASRLTTGEREKEYAWTVGDRKCAGRPDVVAPDFVCDLKTSSTSHPDWFPPRGVSLNYHAQLAWYVDGLETLDGRKRDAFIVCAEPIDPYAITCFKLTDRALEMGRKQNRLWLERLVACERANAWPTYVQGIVPFDVADEGPAIVFDSDDIDPFVHLQGQLSAP